MTDGGTDGGTTTTGARRAVVDKFDSDVRIFANVRGIWLGPPLRVSNVFDRKWRQRVDILLKIVCWKRFAKRNSNGWQNGSVVIFLREFFECRERCFASSVLHVRRPVVIRELTNCEHVVLLSFPLPVYSMNPFKRTGETRSIRSVGWPKFTSFQTRNYSFERSSQKCCHRNRYFLQ